MRSDSSKSRFFLLKLFGTSVNIKIIEILLQKVLEEQQIEKVIWTNFSEIASLAGISKSSSKRILEDLIKDEFVEEKNFVTHAQNPPRMVRLNSNNSAISELIFFYKKVRGFL